MSQLKQLINFTKKQRTGIIILLTIIAILFLIDISIKKIFPQKYNFDNTKYKAQVDSFINSLEPKEQKAYYTKLDSFIIAKYDTLKLFPFDPNTTTPEQWLKLGLTKKQIRTIENYKSRGGKFFIKEDFRKIYGIRYMQYKILKPYITLPDSLEKKQVSQTNNSQQDNTNTYKLFKFDPNIVSKEQMQQLGFSQNLISELLAFRNNGGKFYKRTDFKKLNNANDSIYNRFKHFIIFSKNPLDGLKFEINSSDTNDLMKLPGIGHVIAQRIIKYRNKLGGFYDINQLKEVYGLSLETFNKIKQYITVDESKIKKININFADFKKIISHPYFDKNTTVAILNYRKKNGLFSSTEQLEKQKILTKKQFEKIKKYITVN